MQSVFAASSCVMISWSSSRCRFALMNRLKRLLRSATMSWTPSLRTVMSLDEVSTLLRSAMGVGVLCENGHCFAMRRGKRILVLNTAFQGGDQAINMSVNIADLSLVTRDHL